MRENEAQTECDEEIARRVLRQDEARERLIFGDEALVNEVIARYLLELERAPAIPVVRGYCALSPVPKPKTLDDAKRIVDGR